MELTVLQLAGIGLIASVLTRGLQLVANNYGYKPGRVVVNAGLFVLATVLAVAFAAQSGSLPDFNSGDPAEIANTVLVFATAVLGSASLIYNLLLDKVLLPANA